MATALSYSFKTLFTTGFHDALRFGHTQQQTKFYRMKTAIHYHKGFIAL